MTYDLQISVKIYLIKQVSAEVMTTGWVIPTGASSPPTQIYVKYGASRTPYKAKLNIKFWKLKKILQY